MKISANWLREYINTDASAEKIADKLTLLGLEVEEVTQTGSDFKNFVVGRIESVSSHPNADRLTLCMVHDGKESKQIICGADNVAAGQNVPLAIVGAHLPVPLPDGSQLKIRKAKIRGEQSFGMICSEKELGLSDDHTGIMILDENIKPGTPLNEVINEDIDFTFEIGLTPNRPDAACHLGVARDLSTVVEGKFSSPYKEVKKSKKDLSDKIDICIEDSEKCHRYVGYLVEGVTIKESPDWLQKRLKSIGLRPINNVVDITNFVLHEVGQPLHAFDYDKIGGKKIVVKSFDKPRKFKTLDDAERTVPADTLFICDGNGPVAIAGVMGGEDSEVSESTKNILIESAYFDPSSIRKASKNLALQTDSSYRFERGIDPTMQVRAAKRAAQLITEIAGGATVEGYTDIHPVKHEPVKVDLRVSRVNHLLGTDLKMDQVLSILKNLEFVTEQKDKDTLTCTVPPFRPDISREVDLIEEVGRVFDYNNIPTPETSPSITPEQISDWESFKEKVRNAAKSLAYKEISSNSLLSKKEVSLLSSEENHVDTLNPVSQENTTLRTSLVGGFLKTASFNLNRNRKSLRFFEIGNVFSKTKGKGTWVDGVSESTHLLFGVCGIKQNESWQSKPVKFSVFDLKSDLEAFLIQLGLSDKIERKVESSTELHYEAGGNRIAKLRMVEKELLTGFDVDENLYTAEIDLSAIFKSNLLPEDTVYQKVPKFPSFEFDAAFTIDKNVRAGDLSAEIKQTAGVVLTSVDVFDVYEGENLGKDKKSIAFRLTFLDSNKTLTINDVEPVVQKVVRSLEKKFDAKLRS